MCWPGYVCFVFHTSSWSTRINFDLCLFMIEYKTARGDKFGITYRLWASLDMQCVISSSKNSADWSKQNFRFYLSLKNWHHWKNHRVLCENFTLKFELKSFKQLSLRNYSVFMHFIKSINIHAQSMTLNFIAQTLSLDFFYQMCWLRL